MRNQVLLTPMTAERNSSIVVGLKSPENQARAWRITGSRRSSKSLRMRLALSTGVLMCVTPCGSIGIGRIGVTNLASRLTRAPAQAFLGTWAPTGLLLEETLDA